MFGNKNSIYFILLPFKGTATLFQLLKNISFTFSQDFRVRLLLPEVQTWICISKRAVGHCSNLWVWGTTKPKAPGFNGHEPESNISANETCWRPQKIFREKLGIVRIQNNCLLRHIVVEIYWQKYLRPPSVLTASSPKSVNIPIILRGILASSAHQDRRPRQCWSLEPNPVCSLTCKESLSSSYTSSHWETQGTGRIELFLWKWCLLQMYFPLVNGVFKADKKNCCSGTKSQCTVHVLFGFWGSPPLHWIESSLVFIWPLS